MLILVPGCQGFQGVGVDGADTQPPPAPGRLVKAESERDLSPAVSAGELDVLVSGNSEFALDLYQSIRTEEGNLLYSPHSISVALAMTCAGAETITEAEMREVLHFALAERVHPAFNALDLELAQRGEGAAGADGEPFRLHVVNALWGQDGFGFLPEFLELLAAQYDAGLRALDFRRDAEGARQRINEWVAGVTEQRIKDLLPRGVLTATTKLVLTNAVYFNAAWRLPFEPARTHDSDFFRLSGDAVTVPMMRQTARFGYATGDGYQAIELRYDGDELSMLVLVPDRGRFDDFEAGLGTEGLHDVVTGLQRVNVDLTMPKYEYTATLGLREVLAGMGMPSAFSPAAADFSGMTGDRDLFVSDVLHKAFIKVNEAGTEAAAATAVIMEPTSLPPPPIRLVIDRPFVFVIRDIPTGALLFVGRVVDPSA
jgi:serpin B